MASQKEQSIVTLMPKSTRKPKVWKGIFFSYSSPGRPWCQRSRPQRLAMPGDQLAAVFFVGAKAMESPGELDGDPSSI